MNVLLGEFLYFYFFQSEISSRISSDLFSYPNSNDISSNIQPSISQTNQFESSFTTIESFQCNNLFFIHHSLHLSLQIVHPDYCEYQKRLQKKSPQSSYHLDVICTRSTSFNGTHPLKFSRYSMHDFRQTPTHSPYSKGKRSHERQLSPLKKTSLPSRTSTSSTYIRETPVQYVNYKYPLSNKTRI